MKQDFSESLAHTEAACPLDAHSTEDFDFASIYTREEGAPVNEYERLIGALNAVLDFSLNHRTRTKDGRLVPARIGLHLIALAWVINPDRFNGKSLFQVARVLHRHGVKLSTLRKELYRSASRFTGEFGVSNRSQSHGAWSRKPAVTAARPRPEK